MSGKAPRNKYDGRIAPVGGWTSLDQTRHPGDEDEDIIQPIPIRPPRTHDFELNCLDTQSRFGGRGGGYISRQYDLRTPSPQPLGVFTPAPRNHSENRNEEDAYHGQPAPSEVRVAAGTHKSFERPRTPERITDSELQSRLGALDERDRLLSRFGDGDNSYTTKEMQEAQQLPAPFGGSRHYERTEVPKLKRVTGRAVQVAAVDGRPRRTPTPESALTTSGGVKRWKKFGIPTIPRGVGEPSGRTLNAGLNAWRDRTTSLRSKSRTRARSGADSEEEEEALRRRR
ncbi:hypothetical protein T439DRAFT_359989 [Meredithblackwellia eburnea MCA 4105]